MEEGTKYSVFDELVGQQLDEGAVVSFLFEEREPFPVIVGLGEDAPVGAPQPGKAVGPGSSRDRMIVRQACLKAAASVLPRSDDPGAEVMRLAERFEQWVAEAG